MIEIGYFMTIITLYKQGESQRKIARLVGHDRKTVRRIIKLYKEKGIIEPIKKAEGVYIRWIQRVDNRINGKRYKRSKNT